MPRPQRVLHPAAWLAAAVIVLDLATEHGMAAGLPHPLANAAALGHWAIVLAAPLLLHPVAFFRGDRPAERVGAALVPGAAWWGGEAWLRMRHGHGLAEALFLASMVPSYLLIQLWALEIVLSEAVCRGLARRTRRPVEPGSRRGFLLGAVGVVAWLASDALLGSRLFLGSQRIYRALFGSPVVPPSPSPAPLPAAAPAAPRGRRPNFVVILSDDHRADALGCAGHPYIDTPALDRLAAEGVRFRNAFVTTSLCSPSRGSFLTGQYPHRHGVIDNFSPWSHANRTFFEPLARSGYRNAFIGKWHMPGGLPALRGVERFTSFTAVGGQGLYHDCPLVVDGHREPSRKRYIAEELTDRALEFVRAHRDEPFCLYLAHKNVHAPFTPDAPESGRHADTPVSLPEGSHSYVNLTDAQYVHFMPGPLEAWMRRYAECVESMDRQIGRLLDTLDALGLAEDTVVVYTSDNGYLWGEHQLIDKRWAYDESIRVPWLVRHPRLAAGGATSDRLVLNIDLAPTLLDLAGLPPSDAVQGRSLVPLLRDSRARFRDAFYYAYFFEPPYPVPTIEAVRSERHKYVAYHGRPPQIFDLAADPRERHDLAGTPAGDALTPVLRDRLAALRAEVGAPGGG